MLTLIKAAPGRIARVSPTGAFIPHDQWIPVQWTHYLDRLEKHHGDIIVKVEPAKPASSKGKPDETASK